MENTDMPPLKRWTESLASGLVIPALPLALSEDGQWSERHQQALLRYYIESGAGGVAAAVHSTQFEIRDPEHGLFEPVLRLTSEVLDQYAAPDFVRIAGICGRTPQAIKEAEFIRDTGYHAGLVSLAALSDSSESAAIEHIKAVSEVIPVIGFYLQPAVGGRVYRYSFWREFCEIENVIAIKIAPFNRYQTWDVIRAVIESGRRDITLYTGNDDNIISDLITPFVWKDEVRYIAGGLLGQWGVWTKAAVEMFPQIKTDRASGTIASHWMTQNAALTDANAAVFDAANGFSGCIPGILEVLRRQGLVPSTRCLNANERMSPGQAEELDRIIEAYPEFIDDEFVAENLDRWLE
ncbi:MAG: hypothetical protein P1U89_10435 [Verrucomicrobiales bacterium]|nr:hypothetical protein [Verrucomicrobiales bacterium]